MQIFFTTSSLYGLQIVINTISIHWFSSQLETIHGTENDQLYKPKFLVEINHGDVHKLINHIRIMSVITLSGRTIPVRELNINRRIKGKEQIFAPIRAKNSDIPSTDMVKLLDHP